MFGGLPDGSTRLHIAPQSAEGHQPSSGLLLSISWLPGDRALISGGTGATRFIRAAAPPLQAAHAGSSSRALLMAASRVNQKAMKKWFMLCGKLRIVSLTAGLPPVRLQFRHFAQSVHASCGRPSGTNSPGSVESACVRPTKRVEIGRLAR